MLEDEIEFVCENWMDTLYIYDDDDNTLINTITKNNSLRYNFFDSNLLTFFNTYYTNDGKTSTRLSDGNPTITGVILDEVDLAHCNDVNVTVEPLSIDR